MADRSTCCSPFVVGKQNRVVESDGDDLNENEEEDQVGYDEDEYDDDDIDEDDDDDEEDEDEDDDDDDDEYEHDQSNGGQRMARAAPATELFDMHTMSNNQVTLKTTATHMPSTNIQAPSHVLPHTHATSTPTTRLVRLSDDLPFEMHSHSPDQHHHHHHHHQQQQQQPQSLSAPTAPAASAAATGKQRRQSNSTSPSSKSSSKSTPNHAGGSKKTINTEAAKAPSSSPSSSSPSSSSSSSSSSSLPIVPTMSNVDEIFHLVSQKIATYCQVLADLTNCEVFYKAQLSAAPSSVKETAPHSHQPRNANGKSSSSSSNQSKAATTKKNNASCNSSVPNGNGNKQHHKQQQQQQQQQRRSLYWGTHQMLFDYSHNQGLRYDKTADSLIRIDQRSLTNDVHDLIEEILNEPGLNLQQIDNITHHNNTTTTQAALATQTVSRIALKYLTMEIFCQIVMFYEQTPCRDATPPSVSNPVHSTEPIKLPTQPLPVASSSSSPSPAAAAAATTSSPSASRIKNKRKTSPQPMAMPHTVDDSVAVAASSAPPAEAAVAAIETPLKFKDCCVYLKRLNEPVFDSYLAKFEYSYCSNLSKSIVTPPDDNEDNTDDDGSEHEHENNGNGNEEDDHNDDDDDDDEDLEELRLPSDDELYSDDYCVELDPSSKYTRRLASSQTATSTATTSTQQMTSGGGETSLVIGPDELDEIMAADDDTSLNDEDYHTCELCMNASFKHLTQYKLHHLKHHDADYRRLIMSMSTTTTAINDYDDDADCDLDGVCPKCKLRVTAPTASSSIKCEYYKHLLVCFYPDMYTCKTCGQAYDDYKQYLFHVRYIHTHLVYMCSLCNRKYKHIKQLLEHDQLMHSKTLNYCEICYEAHKSRSLLYEHYATAHLVHASTSTPTPRKSTTDTTTTTSRESQHGEARLTIASAEDNHSE